MILVAPRYSVAVYLDSGSEAKRKNYAYIKGVLDDALEGYARKGGDFRKGAENVKDGRHMFKHVIKFPCVNQPPNSVKEAFYALHHMRAIIQNEHRLTTPASVRGWAEEHARIEDAELRDDFFRIQNQIATILQADVITRGGTLSYARPLAKREIEDRLRKQRDTRTWTTKDCYKPFPEPCQPKSS